MDRNLEQRSKQNLKKKRSTPLASILPSVSFCCQRQTRSLLVHTSSSSSLPGGALHLGYIQGNASAQWVAGKPCRPYTSLRWVQTLAVKRRIAIANEVRAVSLASHSCTKSGQSRRRLASCSRAKHHHDHPSSRSVCVPCGCVCMLTSRVNDDGHQWCSTYKVTLLRIASLEGRMVSKSFRYTIFQRMRSFILNPSKLQATVN